MGCGSSNQLAQSNSPGQGKDQKQQQQHEQQFPQHKVSSSGTNSGNPDLHDSRGHKGLVRFTSGVSNEKTPTKADGVSSGGVAPLRGPMLAMASFHSRGSSFGRDDTIECGVSLAWLEEFASHIGEEMTTEELVRQFIVPETEDEGCRYADLIPADFLGPPSYFVSHMWSARFRSTVKALCAYIGPQPDSADIIVWLDIFALNQHPQQKATDLNTLTRIIKSSKKTLLCLDPEGKALQRLWVLYEVWQTVVAKTARGLQLLSSPDTDYRMLERAFNHIDVKHAKTSLEDDRERLMGGIKGTISSTALNHVIRKALGDSVTMESQDADDQMEAESSDLADMLLQCGRFLKVCGRLSDAEAIVRRTLFIYEHTLGESDKMTSAALKMLGALLHLQNQWSEAEVHLMRALAIDEDLHGIDHPATYTALVDLGKLVQEQGKLDEAEPLLRRALAIQEAMVPAATPGDLGASLINLSSLLKTLGKKGEAERLARRSLVLLEEGHKANVDGCRVHPQITRAMSTLAALLQEHNEEEAESLFRRAMESAQAAVGSDHHDSAVCQVNLANLLAKQGKLEEAEKLLRSAVQADEKTLGGHHPGTAVSLGALASVLKAAGNIDECMPLLKRVVEINEKAVGADTQATAESMIRLAEVLEVMGRYKDAESYLRRAVHVQEKLLGSENPTARKSRRRLSHVVQEWSKSAAKQS